MKNKITIITNDAASGAGLSSVLKIGNYDTEVVIAQPGEKIELTKSSPDLILIDIDKPKEYPDALSCIGNIPTIILYEKNKPDTLDEVLDLLENGAVDAVEKPFVSSTLLSAIQGYFQGKTPAYWQNDMPADELALDKLRRLAVFDAKSVKLTRIEYEILQLMFTSPNCVVLYSVFQDHIEKLTTKISETAIDGYVKTLADKLETIGVDASIEKEECIGYYIFGNAVGNGLVEMVDTLITRLLNRDL